MSRASKRIISLLPGFAGFFDDREGRRLPQIEEVPQLGKWTRPYLRHLLHDEDENVQLMAILALGKIRHHGDVPLLKFYLYHGFGLTPDAARIALNWFSGHPEADRAMRVYDAAESSQQFSYNWQKADRAVCSFYIERFKPIQETQLLVTLINISTVPISSLIIPVRTMWKFSGVIKGIQVDVSPMPTEYSKIHIPKHNTDNSEITGQHYRCNSYNSARFVLEFSNSRNRDRCIDTLPGFLTQELTHFSVFHCKIQLLISDFSYCPEVMQFQSAQHNLGYNLRARWGDGNLVKSPFRNPDDAIEGGYREEARRRQFQAGDILVVSEVSSAPLSSYGIIRLEKHLSGLDWDAEIHLANSESLTLKVGDTLTRKFFWREVPVSVDSDEPHHVLKTVDYARISQC